MAWHVSSPHTIEAVLRRDREVVVLVLATVIAASWLYLLAGAGTSMYPHEMAVLVPDQIGKESIMPGMPMPPATWTPDHVLLMFAMWWLMMIAMMLPSAAPMVLLHAAVTRRGLELPDGAESNPSSHQARIATTVFIAGYLLMWGAFSLAAVAAQWALERGGLLSAMMMPTSSLLGSTLLLAAGIWQLTPLKTACLRRCRSPAHFLSTHWRPGAGGAFRMGLEHGVYCLGCCWFLMALLFYGGVMNLIWITGLALYVLAEKLMPVGIVFGRVIGFVLIAWGAWLGFTAV